MNSHAHILAALATLFFGALTLAVGAVLVYLWVLSGDCTATGGTFSIDGGTAWCRY